MSEYRVAFIGTGPNPDEPDWGNSAAMAYRHAAGYRKLVQCEIVACADLVHEHAQAFADEFDIDHNHIYEDYAQMLTHAEPDVVSVCTPVPTHADIVVDCARDGDLQAVHCEKPMTPSSSRRFAFRQLSPNRRWWLNVSWTSRSAQAATIRSQSPHVVAMGFSQ